MSITEANQKKSRAKLNILLKRKTMIQIMAVVII